MALDRGQHDEHFGVVLHPGTAQSIRLALVFLTFSVIFVTINNFDPKPIFGSELTSDEMPDLSDPELDIEHVFNKEIKREGGDLSPISTMAFLDSDDILLLNKNNGMVNRVVDGILLEEPLLDVNVANERERGMLGIATSASIDNEDGTIKYVFLYYTESSGEDGNDICTPDYCEMGNYPLGNRLYRYELKDNKLLYPKLLLDLPATPGPVHNGGIIEVGPDNNLYRSRTR